MTTFIKNLEKKLPFEMKEENLKEIARNVIERARQIRESLKSDPVGTVKNYKTLLDLPSLAPVKRKTKKKVAPKKALKKVKTAKTKKAVH